VIVDLGFQPVDAKRGVGMSQFGTEPGKLGFNDLTKEYKKSPTIENYVRLRREYPEGEVEVSTTGGLDFTGDVPVSVEILEAVVAH
jgi:hypothetical protein